LNVAFFHPYPHQYAGAQRLTQALACELATRGHRAIIVVPDEGPFTERLRAAGLPIRIVRAPSSWRAYGRSLERTGAAAAIASLPRYWLKVRAVLRSLGADVVHVNDHRGILLAGAGAALAGKPVVWHLHGSYSSHAITLLGRTVARRIVVVSEATRNEQRWLPRDSEKVVVVHNGVISASASDRTNSPGRPHGTGRASRLVVTGARQHPDKGLDVLVRAVALLREKEPELRVVIAGAVQPGYEAHHSELASLVNDLDLGRTISFVGLVDDPLELWRSAEVYVQSSRREPFGLGVIEAMSVGTPVVTTAVGGMCEIVEPERSGLQVPAGDAEALAGAIGRVLREPHLATRLARGGRERAEVFSMARMVDRILEIYEQAVAQI
jgi:glycosyltransferase involved in cell wall biosynthesis